MGILDRILRAGEGKRVKALQAMVPDINALEPAIQRLTDDQLRAKTTEFRERLANGAGLDPSRLPQRALRQGCAPGHGQRLPGAPRLGVDGPDPPLPRSERRARDPR